MEMTEEGIWSALLDKTRAGKIRWKEVSHGNGYGDEPFRGNTEFESFIPHECRITLSKLNEVSREGFEIFVSCLGEHSCKFLAETGSPQSETAEELYSMLGKSISDRARTDEASTRSRVLSKLISTLSA